MTGHSEEKSAMLDDRTKVRGDASGSAMTLGLSNDAKALRASWRCECIRDDSWAHASKHEGAAIPKTSTPPARQYLTQYSAVRWASGENTMGESKARDLMVVESRRWYVFWVHCLSRFV